MPTPTGAQQAARPRPGSVYEPITSQARWALPRTWGEANAAVAWPCTTTCSLPSPLHRVAIGPQSLAVAASLAPQSFYHTAMHEPDLPVGHLARTANSNDSAP